MRASFLLLLLFCGQVIGRQICARRHFTLDSPFFQRVDLLTATACVERCIEYIDYCRSAVFVEVENKQNGICHLHPTNSQDNARALQPETNSNEVSTVFEILDTCSSVSQTEMTSEISEVHRKRLDEPHKSTRALSSDIDDVIIRKADSFIPEKDSFSHNDDMVVYDKNEKGYATMKSMDEPNPSRNPFDTPVPDSISSKVRPSFQADNLPDHITSPHYEIGPTRDLQPITPVEVRHHGTAGLPQLSASHDSYRTAPCQVGAPCAPTLHQMDRSPCPARQGDPCAPRRPCSRQHDVYQSAPCAQEAEPESIWGEWSGCSVTCGTGLRTRSCHGNHCEGGSTSPCIMPRCQEWTSWTMWSACSASCGHSTRSRRRECRGGNDCPGSAMESEDCHLPMCADWSTWGPWEPCTVTCGIGKEKRYRRCEGGLTCPGLPLEDRICQPRPCPYWSMWSPWSHCTVTCGGGQSMRTRECVNGPGCAGGSEERHDCNNHPCPAWTDWTAWTLCETKCGSESVRLRNRACLFKGIPYAGCEGAAQDQSPCPVTQCPMWNDWGDWTECSQTCGQGSQTRTRTCDGNGCDGSNREMRFCQISVCPYWGEWEAWGGCSVTCGLGVCERRRKCVIDDIVNLPSLDELEAAANAEDEDHSSAHRLARMQPAQARAMLMSKHRQLMQISNSNNTYSRSRRQSGILDNIKCDGSDVDRKPCDAGPCCGWEEWSEWTQCTSCGAGALSKRVRTCPGQSLAGFTPPLLFQLDAMLPPSNDPLRPTPDHYPINRNQNPLDPSLNAYEPNSPYQNLPTLNGLQPIIPINHRGKRNVGDFYNTAPSGPISSCRCEGPSEETRPCPTSACESVAEFSRDHCEWTEWGQWCGCAKCRAGREVRRRFCDLPSRIPGGPTIPDPNCSCEGTDTEERTCRVEESCLSSRSSTSDTRPVYPKDDSAREIEAFNRGRQQPGRTIGSFREGGGVGDPEIEGAVFSSDEQSYVSPIVSTVQASGPQRATINRAHTSNQEDNQYKKDSIISSTTDTLTGELCRWSKWSRWTSCQATRLKQRNRFCIGSDSLGSNCCMGLSTEETSCTPNSKVASSVEFIAVSNNRDRSEPEEEELSSQYLPGQEDSAAEDSSKNEKKCDWARWSQWSTCTASCGPAERIRRRRCPCGEDSECGGGINTENEMCNLSQCEKTATSKQYPKFSIVA